MADKEKIKHALGKLPWVSEAWWAVRGKKKPWSSHFKLEGLRGVLTGAVTDVRQLAMQNGHPKKVLVFASLHYWIEQAGLIALALAGQGHKVALGYLPYADWDKPINDFDLRRQAVYAKEALKPAEEVMKVACLTDAAVKRGKLLGLPEETADIIEHVSRYDVMYTRQIETVDPEDPLYLLRMERNAKAALALYRWFSQESPDVVIVPNGTILEMGVAYAMARVMGIHAVTFEFADQRERIWLAQDSEIMTHDTTALWSALGNRPLPERAREKLVELFSARKKAITWGEFARQWQASPQRGSNVVREALGLDERPLALLATNVLGDSLTLGRQKISASMAEWVVKTIDWFRKRPDLQLVARIHPGELITHGTSMVEVIEEQFGGLPENIHVIKPGEKVNTYDLVDLADFGLVFTTTVGLEMAMAGLPVMVAGKTHYANKGFTLDPQDWEEYQDMLEKVASDPVGARLSKAQVEQAWMYAYLFFFEFSLPFPWHLLWLADDFKARPMRYVLNHQGQEKYAKTFGYLVGEPLNWQERGLARLNEQAEVTNAD
ncbi:MAG: glycosyltransferase family 4 protein [Chloroflexi bacterium]|nr:glycosyltransferase family 4 protein [Chloroflexota bacterium]